MTLDRHALTNYGAPVHHVLRCLLVSPDGQATLREIVAEPWVSHLPKPSPPTFRQALHNMCVNYGFIERVSIGVYRLSPDFHLSRDAAALLHTNVTRPPVLSRV
jgi:hypothetical protein